MRVRMVVPESVQHTLPRAEQQAKHKAEALEQRKCSQPETDLGSKAHKANQIFCHSERPCALCKLTMCCRCPDQLTSEKELGHATELNLQLATSHEHVATRLS